MRCDRVHNCTPFALWISAIGTGREERPHSILLEIAWSEDVEGQ
jgi:hypothetical protein